MEQELDLEEYPEESEGKKVSQAREKEELTTPAPVEEHEHSDYKRIGCIACRWTHRRGLLQVHQNRQV